MGLGRSGVRPTLCLMRYHRTDARIRLVSFACQWLSRIAFIFFLEQELAESQAEFFDPQIPLDPPRVANGNLPGLLGNNERDGIRLLAEAKPGAVAQAEVAVQILALGERENARGGHDAVAIHDHAAIVQNGLGMKNREGEFLGELGIDRHACFHKTFEIDVALDRDEGAEAFAGKLEDRVGDVLNSFALLRGRSEKPMAAEFGEGAAKFGLKNDNERDGEENGNAPEQPADDLEIQKLGDKSERQKNQREADEERRKKERAITEKKATSLQLQAARFGAKATKAAAAQQMMQRAEKMLQNLEEVRVSDKVAKLRFPEPAPCGKTPLFGHNLSKSYGSLEIFTAVDLAIDRGSKVVVLGLNGAGKTTLLRILAGVDQPDTGIVEAGHGLKIGYYAQEHETLDVSRTVLENMMSSASHLSETEARKVLGSFLFTGDDVHKLAGVLSGGEKTRLSLAALVVSQANVLLLDEPTNNLDPASREEILGALAMYEGAVVLVSHDDGAVMALNPERVLILPDGVEDHWNSDYQELISLA